MSKEKKEKKENILYIMKRGAGASIPMNLKNRKETKGKLKEEYYPPMELRGWVGVSDSKPQLTASPITLYYHTIIITAIYRSCH